MLNLIHGTDLIVFSSEEFGSEDLRTSKLMNHFSHNHRVFFFHKPITGMTKKPTFYYSKESHLVTVVQPYIPAELSVFDQKVALVNLIKDFIRDEKIQHLTIWTDTPEVTPLIRKLHTDAVIYDKAMQALMSSNHLEQELLQKADVILNSKISDESILVEIDQMKAEVIEERRFSSPIELMMDVKKPANHSKSYMISQYLS